MEKALEPTRMVDITEKPITEREAVAKGLVRMKPETLSLMREGKMAKGEVLAVAQVAGIMAAKQTFQIIPMCHPLLVDEVKVEFGFLKGGVEISARVKSSGKTGVEMEERRQERNHSTRIAPSLRQFLSLYYPLRDLTEGIIGVRDIVLVR